MLSRTFVSTTPTNQHLFKINRKHTRTALSYIFLVSFLLTLNKYLATGYFCFLRPVMLIEQHMCGMCGSTIYNCCVKKMALVFSCEFCEIFGNFFFTQHLQGTAASENRGTISENCFSPMCYTFSGGIEMEHWAKMD